MAYVITITKKSVVKTVGVDDHIITIHVLIKDDKDQIVIEKEYSQRYNSKTDLSGIEAELQKQITKDWDTYIIDQNLYNELKFDTAITNLQSKVNLHINSKE